MCLYLALDMNLDTSVYYSIFKNICLLLIVALVWIWFAVLLVYNVLMKCICYQNIITTAQTTTFFTKHKTFGPQQSFCV